MTVSKKRLLIDHSPLQRGWLRYRRETASRRLSLKRLHQPADIRLHLDLIELERRDFDRILSN